MPLQKGIDEWGEDDITWLIEARIPEFLRLEYKQQLNITTPSERKEFVKDISAFANSFGGIVLYGVREKRDVDGSGYPGGLTPLTDSSLVKKAEDILLSSVWPAFEFRIKPIPAKGEGFYLAIYVPQSLNAPHMVTLGKDNRFYIRREFQTVMMTEWEIRSKYENYLRYREDLDITFQQKEFNIKPNGNTNWCYIISLPLFREEALINTRQWNMGDFETLLGSLAKEGIQFSPSSYGYESIKEDKDGNLKHLLRIHRDGVLEYGAYFENRLRIPVDHVSRMLDHVTHYFGLVYSKVAYFGPVRIYYGINHIRGSKLSISQELKGYSEDGKVFRQDHFKYTLNRSVDELLNNRKEMVLETMDILWQSFGWEKCLETIND